MEHINTLDKKIFNNTKVIEILKKAQSLRGYNLNQLYNNLNLKVPDLLKKSKGHTGQIIEYYLGATAKSKPLPDFPEIGLEIKTIPIDINSNPLESTYICSAPVLNNNTDYIFNFEQSSLYNKIKLILWVTVIFNKNIFNKKNNYLDSKNNNVYSHRIIGPSFLWSPNHKEKQLIKTDWLELSEMLLLGQADKVSSHYGQVLQIRPKAANSKIITTSTDPMGNKINTLPRGFYLRASFTRKIIENNI